MKLIFLVVMILLSTFFYGCDVEQEMNITLDDNYEINIDKLEVIHFHATNQCYSCVAVGDFAKETLETYFSKEIEEGIIEFKTLNGEVLENRESVIKYGATGSSIWLGVYSGDSFEAIQDITVWYKIQDKKQFMEYFRDAIKNKLSGQ